MGGDANESRGWLWSGQERTGESGVQPGPDSNCTVGQPKSDPSPLQPNRLRLCLVREMKIFDVTSDVSGISEGVFGY